MRVTSNLRGTVFAAVIASLAWNVGRTDTPGPVTAIWHRQSFDFQVRTTAALYSCSGVQTKLAAILKALGVQQGMRLECLGASSPRNLQLRLHTRSAVEATEANVAAAVEFDAKDRLLAHIKQQQLPTAADVPRFTAYWREVEVHRLRHLGLDSVECELLEEVRRQIFPRLALRMDKDGLSCRSGAASRLGYRLRVQVLLPEEVNR